MKSEGLRQTSYDTWQTLAPRWERRRAPAGGSPGPAREWLIGELAPRPRGHRARARRRGGG
jgi:hypothetical protein